ncbi:MAG: creatininase family protein [Gammaproteobacteria bacterium]|nr:creatininase family protein [Gammaproteobacteria bacterium]
MRHGVKLETLSRIEAERIFTADPVVVIPLGAAAKEHAPHLLLNNDTIIAQQLLNHTLAQIETFAENKRGQTQSISE